MKGYSRLEVLPLDKEGVREFTERHGSVLYVDIDGSQGYYDRYGSEELEKAYEVIQNGLNKFDFIRTDFKKEYEVPSGDVSIRNEPAFLVATDDKTGLLEEIEKAIQNSGINSFKVTIYPWKE